MQSDVDIRKLQDLGKQTMDAGFDTMVAWAWKRDDGSIGKAPASLHGHLDAHRDQDRLTNELTTPHHPRGLPDDAVLVIAFVPGSGGCGVLDCDVKNGKLGAITGATLISEHGNFATSAWRSPSGGTNIMFAKPPGAVFGNRSPWVGIDVRADNGWVVAPGNRVHGYDWTWIHGDFATPSLLPPTMLSQLTPSSHHAGHRATNKSTIDFIEASPKISSARVQLAFTNQLGILAAASKGSRHEALVRIVGWAFGMEALDLRWAMKRIAEIWTTLVPDDPGRGSEVWELATWTVGQESIKRNSASPNGHSPPSSPSPDSQLSPDSDLVILPNIAFKSAPNPFVVPPITWHAEDLLCRDTHGELAGAEKSLKSYVGLIIDVGLAAGRKVFGHFAVAERQRVSLMIGEGGEMPFLHRLAEVCAAYGIKPGDLDGWLHYTTDRAAANSPRFLDGLRAELETFEPALVHIDPWYVYQPGVTESSQLTSVAAALNEYSETCREGGATALLNHHFNRTDQTGLRKITGAGHAEWVDSWMLCSHREQPDVMGGKYRLLFEVGSRRWGGGSWDIDLDMATIVSPLRWKINPAASQPTTTFDPFVDRKRELINVGNKAQKPLTRSAWVARISKRKDISFAALDELIADGMVVVAGSTTGANNKSATTYIVKP